MTSPRGPGLLALALCCGCEGGAEELDVGLRLTASASCTEPNYASLITLSIDLYGQGPQGLCVLNRDCVTVRDPLGSLDDVKQLLADEVRIRAPSDGVLGVAVVGHASPSCWTMDMPALYGFEDRHDFEATVVDVAVCEGVDPNVVGLCP